MFAADALQKLWRWFVVAAIGVILIVAGVLVFETLPPRTVVMATGAEGGANYEMGISYREILAKAGVKVQLLPTTGSMKISRD